MRKWKCKSLSHVWLFLIPWTAAHQAPLCMRVPQARILKWVAISFFKGSSWPRAWIQVSCIAGRCFPIWATGNMVPSSLQECRIGYRKHTFRASRAFWIGGMIFLWNILKPGRMLVTQSPIPASVKALGDFKLISQHIPCWCFHHKHLFLLISTEDSIPQGHVGPIISVSVTDVSSFFFFKFWIEKNAF